MTHEFDPATQKIIDDFDAHAKKRAAELMTRTENAPLQAMREIAFCFGYKAGVVDLGAVRREQGVVDVDGGRVIDLVGALGFVGQLVAVFDAACAWRDAASQPLSSKGILQEKLRLIDAIDAARAAKAGSS